MRIFLVTCAVSGKIDFNIMTVPIIYNTYSQIAIMSSRTESSLDLHFRKLEWSEFAAKLEKIKEKAAIYDKLGILAWKQAWDQGGVERKNMLLAQSAAVEEVTAELASLKEQFRHLISNKESGSKRSRK